MGDCRCRVINLAAVTGTSSTVNATLVPAGAVAPALSLESNANECSFAQVARDAVRGGPWIAVTADLPQSSIYVSPLSQRTVPVRRACKDGRKISMVLSCESLAPVAKKASLRRGCKKGTNTVLSCEGLKALPYKPFMKDEDARKAEIRC